jgi:hypothetical protein
MFVASVSGTLTMIQGNDHQRSRLIHFVRLVVQGWNSSRIGKFQWQHQSLEYRGLRLRLGSVGTLPGRFIHFPFGGWNDLRFGIGRRNDSTLEHVHWNLRAIHPRPTGGGQEEQGTKRFLLTFAPQGNILCSVVGHQTARFLTINNKR